MGRGGAKARWTSFSGRAIQFAKSDVGDNPSVCNIEILLEVPLRLNSGGKEECEIKDHISEEEHCQEAAVTRVTNADNTKRVLHQ